MTKFCWCAFTAAFCAAVVGCGGGSYSPPSPGSGSFTPADIRGQYQVIAHSDMNPNSVLFVEANFAQTGSDAFAAKSSVVMIQGTQGATGVTLNCIGGECDNGVFGDDSIQATFSDSTHISFSLTQAGDLGTGTTTGNVTFTADGKQIMSGTYSVPAVCGFVADSGTLTGAFVGPFSGSYAGMLTNSLGTADAVILTVSQSTFDLTVSGTDNGTPFALAGAAVGATFNVSGTIAGQAVQYVGVYDPSGNDFLVFDSNLAFLGTLNSGTNPQAISKSVAKLVSR